MHSEYTSQHGGINPLIQAERSGGGRLIGASRLKTTLKVVGPFSKELNDFTLWWAALALALGEICRT